VKRNAIVARAAVKALGQLPAGRFTGLLAMLDEQIGKLDGAVARAAEENPQSKLLLTQPGVGPNTALAFVLTLGDVRRFPRGKQVASYLGLIPREESSGGRQKLGAITKQGIVCCARCWWKRRRLQCVMIRSFAGSICIAATASPRVWRRCSGAQVSRTTLLDAAHANRVSRDRSHREQLGLPLVGAS